MKNNDYKGAIADYTKAIEFKSSLPIAYGGRGTAENLAGDKESGCADLLKAKELGYKDADELIKKYCK